MGGLCTPKSQKIPAGRVPKKHSRVKKERQIVAHLSQNCLPNGLPFRRPDPLFSLLAALGGPAGSRCPPEGLPGSISKHLLLISAFLELSLACPAAHKGQQPNATHKAKSKKGQHSPLSLHLSGYSFDAALAGAPQAACTRNEARWRNTRAAQLDIFGGPHASTIGIGCATSDDNTLILQRLLVSRIDANYS